VCSSCVSERRPKEESFVDGCHVQSAVKTAHLWLLEVMVRPHEAGAMDERQ